MNARQKRIVFLRVHMKTEQCEGFLTSYVLILVQAHRKRGGGQVGLKSPNDFENNGATS